MGVFEQKWLYLGKFWYSCKHGCNWGKVVVLGQKLLCLGKMVVFLQKWLYSDKGG